MSNKNAESKANRLRQLELLLFSHPAGLSLAEIARLLGDLVYRGGTGRSDLAVLPAGNAPGGEFPPRAWGWTAMAESKCIPIEARKESQLWLVEHSQTNPPPNIGKRS